MTQYGGIYDGGVLFEWDPASNTYIKKLDFNGVKNGRWPFGSLMQANNGKLYGMTRGGGLYDDGVIFEWDIAANTFTKKMDFNGENGSGPRGSFIQANNGKVYGMTTDGGVNDRGVLFEWDLTTNTYVKKLDFNPETGGNPDGSLMQSSDGKLYGATVGGANGIDCGIIFEWDPYNNIFTKKHEFNYLQDGVNNGCGPLSSLIESDNGNLYGVTSLGGIHASGVLFKLDPVTDTYIKIFIFNYLENGGGPNFLMQATNGKIYFTTGHGLANESGEVLEGGAIFELDPATDICVKKSGFSNHGPNLAINQPVTQSSTKYYSVAALAVDGNTDGSWASGSVTHTNSDLNAWWEVDLGGIYNISTLEVWNRTDLCCISRLSDFYVFASEKPFQSKELNKTLSQPDVWHQYQSGYPNPVDIFQTGRTARFIRIQSAHTAELNIAEVKVIGSQNEPLPGLSNVALNQPAIQSSTQYGGVAGRAVDGNTSGLWSDGSVTHTNYDQHAWWEVDLGAIYDISTIQLWNRTNSCCIGRLSNFYVFASERFESQELNATLNQPNVWQTFSSGYPDPVALYNVGQKGRYIRIQSAASAELNLAEVIVMGSLSTSETGPVNVAHNKPVTQSSTKYGGVPERAVDGNTNGSWINNSVTHTYYENNAWWEVDLGGTFDINSIELWNRTDQCCRSRLSDYYIFASNAPFVSKQLDATLNQSGIWYDHQMDYPDPGHIFEVDRPARYIRVQGGGFLELNIAEVKVIGTRAENSLKSTGNGTSEIPGIYHLSLALHGMGQC